MPIIPFISGSNPLGKVAAPVLDTQRRPTVDNRQVSQAVGNLANAQKLPDVPMSLAENPGLGAIGRAVAQGGDVLSGLAIKTQEARSDVQIAQHDSAQAVQGAEFEAWKETEPDPAKWGAELEKRQTAFRDAQLANPELTDHARTQIGVRLTRYEGQSAAQNITSVAKQTFAQAKDAFLTSADQAIDSQDFTKLDETLKTGLEKGYIWKHEAQAKSEEFKRVGEHRVKQAEAGKERDAFNLLAADAINAPLKWLEDNKEPWKGDEVRWQKIKNVADARRNEGTQDAVEELSDAIDTGNFRVPAEIDAFAAANPFMTPVLVEKAKGLLARRDMAAAKLDVEQNGTRNAVVMAHEAEGYDKESDPDGTKYFELKQRLHESVPTDRQGEIAKVLDQKWGGRVKEDKLRPEIRQEVSRTLNVLFDGEKGAYPYKTKEYLSPKQTHDEGRWFGPDRFKTGDVIMDPKTGKPKTITDRNGNIQYKWKIDPVAEQRAIQAQAEVERKFDLWAKDNPEKATDPKAVQKALQDFIPNGTQKGVFQSLKPLMGKPTAATGNLTSYGYGGDSTPDRNSSAGIGSFTTEVDAKGGADAPTRLRSGDIAVSPDIEKAFRAAGVAPRGEVLVKLDNGESRRVRWMDRTASDADIAAGKVHGVTQPLRGRFDLYSPRGKHRLDGMRVVGWQPV